MHLRHALLAALLMLGVPDAARGAGKATGAAAHHVRVGAARSGAAPAGVTPRVRPGARTLEDIHIEGEIPVPQVLFITARDQRRFLEFQHGRYLRSSRKLGEDTALPSWIVVTGTRPAQDRGSSR